MQLEEIQKNQRTLESLLSLLREVRTIKSFEVTAAQDDINNNRTTFEVAGVLSVVQSEEIKDAVSMLEMLVMVYAYDAKIDADLYRDVKEWRKKNKWDDLSVREQVEKIYGILKSLNLRYWQWIYTLKKLEKELSSDHINQVKEVKTIYYKGYVQQ